jgi:murein DD-endopeptidase MepM/ murein hydrolase activator NlpD
VSAAESRPSPTAGAEATAPAQYAGVAFYQPDGTIYNTIQIGDDPSAGGAYQWYSVVGGDTVGKIAGRFHISVDTLYWANKNRLPNPNSISVGLRLLIPPVDGITMSVKAGDTLSGLASKYKTTTQGIVIANNLPDESITAGQILVMPVDPPPMPTTKSGCTGNCSYTGGKLLWPVKGYYTISQYYSSRHPAIDLAAATGTPVIAAASGTVIYAGWKTSGGGVGGGIVVWINHNGKLYTTYNHLSAEFVSVGQTVSAGQRIGSVGMTGSATGPHLHFEVWVCYPWSDGTTSCARNPLKYLP